MNDKWSWMITPKWYGVGVTGDDMAEQWRWLFAVSFSFSEPHASDTHGHGYHLSPQCLQQQRVWGPGFLADGGGAGRHCDGRLRGPGDSTPPHGVRALPHGAGRSWTVPTLQWPEAERWLQPRPAREASHLLPDASGPVLHQQPPVFPPQSRGGRRISAAAQRLPWMAQQPTYRCDSGRPGDGSAYLLAKLDTRLDMYWEQIVPFYFSHEWGLKSAQIQRPQQLS